MRTRWETGDTGTAPNWPIRSWVVLSSFLHLRCPLFYILHFSTWNLIKLIQLLPFPLGSVWRAQHPTTQKTVILKVANRAMHSQSIININGHQLVMNENIIDEAQIMKYLSSNKYCPASIIRYIDLFQRYYIHSIYLYNVQHLLLYIASGHYIDSWHCLTADIDVHPMQRVRVYMWYIPNILLMSTQRAKLLFGRGRRRTWCLWAGTKSPSANSERSAGYSWVSQIGPNYVQANGQRRSFLPFDERHPLWRLTRKLSGLNPWIGLFTLCSLKPLQYRGCFSVSSISRKL